MFLSPRVVDREAFAEFSGSLRRLIEDAAGQGEELRSAAEQANAAHQQLRDLATKHTAKFEAAARAAGALDERAAQAEAMLQGVQQAAATLDDFKAQASRATTEQTESLRRRIDELVVGFTQRLEAATAGLEAKLAAKSSETETRIAVAAGEAMDRLNTAGSASEARITTAAGDAEVRLASKMSEHEAALAARLAECERLLGEKFAEAERRAGAAERALSTRLTEAESRISETERACAQRLSEVERRAAAAQERADALQTQLETFAVIVEQKLAEARQTISGFEARGVQSIEDAASTARRSFDGVCEALSGHAEDLRLSLASGAELHREKIDQHTEAAANRAREVASGLARSADAAESRLATMLKRLDEEGEERQRHLGDMLFRAEEAAGEIEALVGLTTALPEEDDEAGTQEALGLVLPGSLADLILKSRAHRKSAEQAQRELGATAEQAETARKLLGESINDGAAKIDALSDKAESLRSELAASLAASERAVLALRDRRAEAEDLIREPMAIIENKLAEVQAYATSMDTRAAKAREVSEQAVSKTATIVRGLADLLGQLKPWEPVLLEAKSAGGTPEIPPGLRRVIEAARTEIAADFAQIATSLQAVATRVKP